MRNRPPASTQAMMLGVLVSRAAPAPGHGDDKLQAPDFVKRWLDEGTDEVKPKPTHFGGLSEPIICAGAGVYLCAGPVAFSHTSRRMSANMKA
jgi:hypothetical protein